MTPTAALRRTALGLAGALALLATPAPAQEAPLYVFLYSAGPAWKAGEPMERQGLGPHAAYIKRLLDEGRLVAGGRMLDHDEGMAIVRAASLEEAKAMLAADPAVTSGIFKGELRAWQPRFDSKKPLRP